MRSVLAWALTSPTRITLVIAAVLGIGIGAALISTSAHRTEPDTQSSLRESPSAGTSTSVGTTPRLAQPPAEEAASAGATRPTVDRFLADYLGPTTKKQLRALKPIVTDQLWTGLRLADPRSLPNGPPTAVTATTLGAYAAVYGVSTPTTSLSVSVVLEPDGWKVDDVEPSDTSSTP